jgi:sugar lactone lactonase YvrE
MEIEVVLDAGATIGESPTWVSAERALYWIDVKKPALYRYDPVTGVQRSWPMPSDIGAFGLVSEPPGAVVALRQGIFRLDFASGSLTLLAPPPFDPTLFRFNEGARDAAGRRRGSFGRGARARGSASPTSRSQQHGQGSPACVRSGISGWRDRALYPLAAGRRAARRIKQ